MASIAVAIVMVHSGIASATYNILWMPITIVVIFSSVVTINGQRYWFQPYMNKITKSAAKFVRQSGSKISKKNFIGPAPSTLAASASSSGTVIKNWRKRKVAVAEAISGSVSPA